MAADSGGSKGQPKWSGQKKGPIKITTKQRKGGFQKPTRTKDYRPARQGELHIKADQNELVFCDYSSTKDSRFVIGTWGIGPCVGLLVRHGYSCNVVHFDSDSEQTLDNVLGWIGDKISVKQAQDICLAGAGFAKFTCMQLRQWPSFDMQPVVEALKKPVSSEGDNVQVATASFDPSSIRNCLPIYQGSKGWVLSSTQRLASRIIAYMQQNGAANIKVASWSSICFVNGKDPDPVCPLNKSTAEKRSWDPDDEIDYGGMKIERIVVNHENDTNRDTILGKFGCSGGF